jgi:predicted AAA+ superfamily ATPase
MLKKYYFTGGMPEAVKTYIQSRDLLTVRTVQKEIINSYILDFAKHAPTPDIPKLSLILDSIPSHLARENKKFMFSAIKKGARARGYETSLQWLEDAGLIYKAFSVSTAKHPLKGYMDRSCFKIYALDVGILGAMADIPIDVLAYGNRLFKEYSGALVENYAALQLPFPLNPLLSYLEDQCLLHRVCPIRKYSGASIQPSYL